MSAKSVENPFDSAAKFFKLFSHPARLQILNAISKEEACVCHLEAILGYRQAYISQHLMALREAGLIHDRRDGWNVYYQVSDPRVNELLELIHHRFLDSNDLKSLSQTKKCQCPKCTHETLPEKWISENKE